MDILDKSFRALIQFLKIKVGFLKRKKISTKKHQLSQMSQKIADLNQIRISIKYTGCPQKSVHLQEARSVNKRTLFWDTWYNNQQTIMSLLLIWCKKKTWSYLTSRKKSLVNNKKLNFMVCKIATFCLEILRQVGSSLETNTFLTCNNKRELI